MRFHADGPNIPDSLLQRRDEGCVVFLCGAGVSLDAGMPTFPELTEYVVDFFDPPRNSDIARSFEPWRNGKHEGTGTPPTVADDRLAPTRNKDQEEYRIPLDRIFHMLHREYGRDEVNGRVAERLGERNAVGNRTLNHKLIARISSDQYGDPQIVTTNFDRLFETVANFDIRRIYEPPTFPDIVHGVPITGITYLHGRLEEPDARHHPYVLSSADFGKAYLSEGWATAFVRSLLNRYTVVLIGYQAEDPPVNYLLQGLNHDGKSDRSTLYAFDRECHGDIEAKWRDRGVTAITYCGDHSNLWKSLESWAERADDLRTWRSRVMALAQKGPTNVEAHERGQVAHLVRTVRGARLFAETDHPSPPAEWLCVFDASCRTAEKSRKGHGEDAETFDPLEIYGLDDDPPRLPTEVKRSPPDDLLGWHRGDANPADSHRIAGRRFSGFEEMPPRLLHIIQWIARHLDDPVTAWWAVRPSGLHPRLMKLVRDKLIRDRGLHPEARRIWNLILECQSDHRNFARDEGQLNWFDWFDLTGIIEKEGWTSSIIRAHEAEAAPILSRVLPLELGKSKPPSLGWEEIDSEELVHWAIKYPDGFGYLGGVGYLGEVGKTVPPDAVVEQVFRIAEGHLRRASGLLADIRATDNFTPTCYPGREMDEEEYPDGDALFRRFLELFERMLNLNPSLLRTMVDNWPEDDGFFFRKLKLFALNREQLFEADTAAKIILSLDQESFWDPHVVRELLFVLHDRWNEFSETDRVALGNRLLDGPNESDRRFDEDGKQRAARYTRWLTLKDRTLTAGQTEKLETLMGDVSGWNDGWASKMAIKHGMRDGSVDRDEMLDDIANLPVNEIVERIKEIVARTRDDRRSDFSSSTEKHPFIGLVRTNPRKTLAALSFSARNEDFPPEFWGDLIREWPNDASPRLYRVFLHRLGRLPEEVVRKMRHRIGWWFEERFADAMEFDEELAWATFDRLVPRLVSDGRDVESVRTIMRVSGEFVEESRRTYVHAINGPIGTAAKELLRSLFSLNLGENDGIPNEYKLRFDRLLEFPGEGCDNIVAVLAHAVDSLHRLDPDWVANRMMPWFDFDHPLAEPAWNGALSSGKIPSAALRAKLKSGILDLFSHVYSFEWDRFPARDLAIVAANWIVWMTIFRPSEPDGITVEEARRCLRFMDDHTHNQVILLLRDHGRDEPNGWVELVIPFVRDVWPRELKFRTGSSSSFWVSLLADAGDMFPSVLNEVRRFLVPTEKKSDWRLFSFDEDSSFGEDIGGEESLTDKYPAEVLELLDAVVPNDPDAVPHRLLTQALELIESADSKITKDRRYRRLINLVERF